MSGIVAAACCCAEPVGPCGSCAECPVDVATAAFSGLTITHTQVCTQFPQEPVEIEHTHVIDPFDRMLTRGPYPSCEFAPPPASDLYDGQAIIFRRNGFCDQDDDESLGFQYAIGPANCGDPGGGGNLSYVARFDVLVWTELFGKPLGPCASMTWLFRRQGPQTVPYCIPFGQYNLFQQPSSFHCEIGGHVFHELNTTLSLPSMTIS